MLVAALLVVVAAVALLPTDPRLAIAGAISLSNLGIAVVVINHEGALVPRLFVAAAPMVLAIAVTRTRRLLRRAPISGAVPEDVVPSGAAASAGGAGLEQHHRGRVSAHRSRGPVAVAFG